ncbi:MAG: ribonuclease H [Halobacteriaceae archaeon]
MGIPRGPRRLRELFDDSPTPHIAHRPRTHHRDYYVATDGSFSPSGAGLGVVIEDAEGEVVARRALGDDSPDNNVAEYRALHLGLDTLAARAPRTARVGVLVDHDDLAGNVNSAVIAGRSPEYEPLAPLSIPPAAGHHWRGIRARIAGFGELRAARIDSRANPAHPLANTPEEYGHVNTGPRECPVPWTTAGEAQIPPPSRAERRQAGD